MDPEPLALALRERHPDADPLALDADTLAAWVADAGGDPDDDALVARAVVAWEGLLS